MLKVSSGQVGLDIEGVMDPQPNLSPDLVRIKDVSVKKARALQVSLEAFDWFI